MSFQKRIQIFHPLPSDLRWLEEHLVFESIRDQFFEQLMKVLSKEQYATTLIDDVWTSGTQHRKNFMLLSKEQQDMIYAIPTNTARCWLNGVEGLDWDDGFI